MTRICADEIRADKTARLSQCHRMSKAEILDEIPKLKPDERDEIRRKLDELGHAVDLRTRGIGEAQAADLRSRLSTFAEDWNRPEMDIYDEDPAR